MMYPCGHEIAAKTQDDHSKTVDCEEGPIIFLRHGIFADHRTFDHGNGSLLRRLREIPGVTIDNQNYCWQCPIVRNGILLACQIKDACAKGRDVIIIGHSMGGLIGRIALVALRPGNELKNSLSKRENERLWPRGAWKLILAAADDFKNRSDAPVRMRGLITLATPNSGAFTHFGASNLANLLTGHAKLVGKVLGSAMDVAVDEMVDHGCPAIQDLTSARVFRLLQALDPDSSVKVLSVSGSYSSRLSQGGITKMRLFDAGLRLTGLHKSLPNDVVVEDSSVDLRESCLPNEIVENGFGAGSHYEHRRAYENSIDVHHCNICDSEPVTKLVREKVALWLQ